MDGISSSCKLRKSYTVGFFSSQQMEGCISGHGVEDSRDTCCLGVPFWPYG